MAISSLHHQLSNALHNARLKQRLTQVELSNALKKPQSFISKYENGERRLNVIEFLEVCRALGVKPEAILRQLEMDDE